MKPIVIIVIGSIVLYMASFVFLRYTEIVGYGAFAGYFSYGTSYALVVKTDNGYKHSPFINNVFYPLVYAENVYYIKPKEEEYLNSRKLRP